MNYMNHWTNEAKSQVFFYIEQDIKKYSKDVQQWLWVNIPKLLTEIEQCWIEKYSSPDMDTIYTIMETMIKPAVDVMVALNMEEIMLNEDIQTIIVTVDEMDLIQEATEIQFNDEDYYE